MARSAYTIRDALYGSVPLSPAAYATLDTRAFQRLKHLKQVGPAYLVYPGATHTRFSHSIGVYHLAELALQHLGARITIHPEVSRATEAAALLHDLGHFPYSHVMDEIAFHGQHLNHARLSVELIETDPELRQVIEEQWQVDPSLVADLVAGRANPRIPRCLYSLIDGPMDIDKLDYLNRDAHHTGVPYGRVEVQRLIDFLEVDPATEDLVITEDGIGTVESVIFAKYLMFRYVYWHHTARIAGTMLNRAVLDCLLALGVEELSLADPRIRTICLATDSTLQQTIASLLDEASVESPSSFCLLERIEDRRLYKRAAEVPCADAGERDARYRDSLLKRQREHDLAALAGSDVLIDVPPVAKFAADIRGIAIGEDEEVLRTVPWEEAPQASYLTGQTVAAMEQSIRSLLYLYDPEGPAGADAAQVLARAVADDR